MSDTNPSVLKLAIFADLNQLLEEEGFNSYTQIVASQNAKQGKW